MRVFRLTRAIAIPEEPNYLLNPFAHIHVTGGFNLILDC